MDTVVDVGQIDKFINVVTLVEIVAMAGTVAFATTAVFAVANRGVDLFSAVVLGIVTAIGGGTVRDLIVNEPVFWSTEPSYIWVAAGSSTIAFFALRLFGRREAGRLFLYIDGLAVAMFAIQATVKVWDLDFARPVGPIMLAVATAIGGGIIRDVLAGRPNLLMSRELYAVPVLLGSIVFVTILAYAPEYRQLGGIVSVLFIFGLRAASIHWGLVVPGWLTVKRSQG